MVLLLASSFLLCFTLLRMESKAPIEKKALLKVEGGLSEIGTTLSKLKRTLEIREALKVLLAKETLNSQDSLLMVSMVAELERAGQTKN